MGMEFKINECGEIIRDNNLIGDLEIYENALLRGDKLKVSIRCDIAKKTQNEEVMWMCVKDKAISVRNSARNNPILTSEMRVEINKRDSINKQLKSNKTFTNNTNTTHRDTDHGKGCLWLIIVACVLGFLYTYLSGETWFPF